jgi:hypothetical protein
MRKNLLALALAAAATASPAGAVDVTGTWEGSVTCSVFDGAYAKTKTSPSTLLIVQEGNLFIARLDDALTYNGGVIDSGDKPLLQGEGAMNLCSTDVVPLGGGDDEIVRMKLKVNPEKGTGTLSGESIFGAAGEARTCKYKYKRTSATAPDVAPCPE